MTNAIAFPAALRKLLPSPLMAASTAVRLRRGDRLFLQRQRPRHMYFVARGEIVLERIGAQGNVVVLQRIRHGFVAEASLQSGSYHCDGLVTAEGEAVALPLDALQTRLARDPEFALRWIGMLNGEVRRLRAQCERLSLKGVGARLLHLIESEGVDGRLAVPSGLKSLATELAVTHEALYRTLATLEKEKVVIREPGGISLGRP
ncbi:MAG: Crp/Fnr family transcriptional regulator [Ramlibacter sp.]|jgi:CRP-like cAMP-binding protein|nr:Crp/Fnr family transcriptional regulator [Ramlibacter sp.]